MNTILITGTVKTIGKPSVNGVDFNTEYDVQLWGSREGEQIQFLRPIDKVLSGYNDLWKLAKETASKYFESDKFQDGAYTQFLDHIK